MLPAPRGASLPRRALQSLLGGGQAYLLLYMGTHVFLAATASGTMFGAVAIVILVVVGGAQVAVMLHRDRHVGGRVAATVAITLTAVTIAGSTLLPRSGDVTGYASWVFGAVTFVLLGLTVAGRFAVAWTTMAAVVAVAVGWSVVTGLGWPVGVALIVRHVATLVVGTLLAAGLRRSTAESEAFRAVERRRRSDERAAQARAAARRTAAQEVLDQAGPMLQAIADERPLTDADRVRLLVIEGALRDQIRTPALVKGPLHAAVARARERGVNVLLLDETEAVADALRARAAVWLAEAVARVDGGRFVGRLRIVDGELTASAVTDVGAETRSFAAD